MAKVVVNGISVSIDGFGAGPDQSLQNPLGIGGRTLHEWAFPTRFFQQMFGQKDGTTGIDNDFAVRAAAGIGAYILGRNMFGPIRGPWPDEAWQGWWGPNPPYHVPVFVLTHHPRPPLVMQGGTTFHFVSDGITSALSRAREAAGDLDVRIGGGIQTIRQYLQAGLVDRMHLALAPALLGRGETLLGGLDLTALGFRCVEQQASPHALHVVLERRPAPQPATS